MVNFFWHIRANAWEYLARILFLAAIVWLVVKVILPTCEIAREIWHMLPKPHGVAEGIVFVLIPIVFFTAWSAKGGKK